MALQDGPHGALVLESCQTSVERLDLFFELGRSSGDQDVERGLLQRRLYGFEPPAVFGQIVVQDKARGGFVDQDQINPAVGQLDQVDAIGRCRFVPLLGSFAWNEDTEGIR